jgi:hypothetical protein
MLVIPATSTLLCKLSSSSPIYNRS